MRKAAKKKNWRTTLTNRDTFIAKKDSLKDLSVSKDGGPRSARAYDSNLFQVHFPRSPLKLKTAMSGSEIKKEKLESQVLRLQKLLKETKAKNSELRYMYKEIKRKKLELLLLSHENDCLKKQIGLNDPGPLESVMGVLERQIKKIIKTK